MSHIIDRHLTISDIAGNGYHVGPEDQDRLHGLCLSEYRANPQAVWEIVCKRRQADYDAYMARLAHKAAHLSDRGLRNAYMVAECGIDGDWALACMSELEKRGLV